MKRVFVLQLVEVHVPTLEERLHEAAGKPLQVELKSSLRDSVVTCPGCAARMYPKGDFNLESNIDHTAVTFTVICNRCDTEVVARGKHEDEHSFIAERITRVAMHPGAVYRNTSGMITGRALPREEEIVYGGRSRGFPDRRYKG